MTDQEEYSKVKLDQAAADLKRQTPQEWIRLQEYIHNLEKNWPEAPASANFHVVYPNGHEVQWTLRDFDEQMLAQRITNLWDEMEHEGVVPEHEIIKLPVGEKKERVSPAGDVSAMVITTPGVSPDTLKSAGYSTFPVEAVIHQVTSGKAVHYLMVKGGNWMLHGWKAWPEVLPVNFNFDDYEVGRELSPPGTMKVAYLDEGAKRVRAFMGFIE